MNFAGGAGAARITNKGGYNMATYVKFELEDGTAVYLETTEVPRGASGLIPPGKPGGHPAEQPGINFAESVGTIRKLATSLVNHMRESGEPAPQELQVNFGLKASAEVGGLVISRGGVEANFNVMLRWHEDKDKEEEEEKEKNQPGWKKADRQRII